MRERKMDRQKQERGVVKTREERRKFEVEAERLRVVIME